MTRLAITAVALALSACAAPPVAVTSTPRPAPAQPPGGMQYLYGSGEAAAASIQAYHAMRIHVEQAARSRPRSRALGDAPVPVESVILADGSTLERPRFDSCDEKPLAVVLDVDETALLNIGYEYDEAVKGRTFDQEIWDRWERGGVDKVSPVPGAVTALAAMRAVGVKIIFNTNRNASSAAFTEAALSGIGLGPARHGDNLFMQGDVGTGSAKDGRRALISSRYCVVAMAGDQLGDFSDLFNVKTLSVPDRRRAAGSGAFAQKWGAGWFMLPNPVYGPGIKGSFDDVFPPDKRWTDPAAKERK